MGEEDVAKPASGKNRVRAERLAKALRENLQRRKAQARGRPDETRPEPETPVSIGRRSRQP